MGEVYSYFDMFALNFKNLHLNLHGRQIKNDEFMVVLIHLL